MAYTPTGRPVGRPKTKDYQTISLKIPQDLLARVQHYAGLHRQSVSELIRDGLEWRITDGDPRWQPLPDARYSGNTEFHTLVQPVHLIDDHIPLEDDLSPRPPGHDNGNTVLPESLQTSVLPEARSQHKGNTVLPTVPPFDPAKYTLGKLCPRQHAHGHTGQSLLRISNRHCLACDREKFHERKQKQRQVQPA